MNQKNKNLRKQLKEITSAAIKVAWMVEDLHKKEKDIKDRYNTLGFDYDSIAKIFDEIYEELISEGHKPFPEGYVN